MAMDRTGPGWALVGRGGELDEIERCHGLGQGAVVVTGPAGVGKSRLAREALARFASLGAQTRWVQATRSAASVPLGAFAGVLPDSARSEDALELLRRSARALAGLGGSGRPVLGIDDAQLLDSSSAALVLELALGAAVFVVLTVRAGEPCPDAITSVWKDSGAERIELGALDAEQTETLAEEIAGGPIEQSARRWIYQTSLGNPLYVRELMRGALSGGALTEVRGLWRMPRRPPVSASLAELITARMTGLEPVSVHALELLALGEPLPLAEMIELAGAETLTDIEARGLATVASTPSAPTTPSAPPSPFAPPTSSTPTTSSGHIEVSLSHPLYGEAIRAGLPVFRRRQVQLELAAAIGRRSHIQARDLIRMARWLAGAGRQVPSTTLLAAAAAANSSGDPDLAAELAGRAAAEGAGIAGTLLLARAYVLQGRYADAEQVLAAAEDAITDAGIPTTGIAVEYLELQATVLYWGLRQPARLHALLDRAQAWQDTPGWRQQLEALRFTGADGPSPAAAALATAEVYDDAEADPEVRRRFAPAHLGNLFFSGRVGEAYDLARRIRPATPLRDLTDELAFTLYGVIALEGGLGWAELDEWATAMVADGIRTGDRAVAGRAALTLGGLRFSQGKFASASRWLAESELQLEQHDAGRMLAIVNSMQVGVACFTGDVAGIDPALGRCEAAFGDEGPLPHELPYVARARAWAALGHGDPPRAQALLLDAAAQLGEMPVYAARLSYEAMRAGARARQLAARLQALTRRCDGRLTAAYAAHATARAAADGDALSAVADEMEAIGALRYATEAAAHAASAYHAAGRLDAARRAAARCHELQATSEGGIEPVIEGLDPGAAALTSRERQLLDFAAQGLSNAEIANRLVLSVRTVESHLYRAMHKIGVTSRHEIPSRHSTAPR